MNEMEEMRNHDSFSRKLSKKWNWEQLVIFGIFGIHKKSFEEFSCDETEKTMGVKKINFQKLVNAGYFEIKNGSYKLTQKGIAIYRPVIFMDHDEFVKSYLYRKKNKRH